MLRRPSRREHLSAVKAQLEGLAAMAGKPAPEYLTRIPGKRGPKKPSGASPVRPERKILGDILKYLHSHPKVAFCMRMQSGLFQQDGRIVRVGTVGLPDIIGMLKGGRFFAIEVKSGRGKTTDSQDYWLDTVQTFGGRSGVARSSEDAECILTGAGR